MIDLPKMWGKHLSFILSFHPLWTSLSLNSCCIGYLPVEVSPCLWVSIYMWFFLLIKDIMMILTKWVEHLFLNFLGYIRGVVNAATYCIWPPWSYLFVMVSATFMEVFGHFHWSYSLNCEKQEESLPFRLKQTFLGNYVFIWRALFWHPDYHLLIFWYVCMGYV